MKQTRVPNHDSRADALELMNSEDESSFKTLVGTIGGDIIELGRVPKTPAEQAILLVKVLLQASQSLKGGEGKSDA